MDFMEKLIDKYIKDKEIDLSIHDAKSLALLRKVIRMRLELQSQNGKIINSLKDYEEEEV
jgi:hypothetical protein